MLMMMITVIDVAVIISPKLCIIHFVLTAIAKPIDAFMLDFATTSMYFTSTATLTVIFTIATYSTYSLSFHCHC